MASRLYPATRRLFWQVVSALQQLRLPSVLTPTTFALLALYICGLILLDRRQTPWRMQAWLPARCHDALNRLLRVGAVSTRALFAPLALWAKRTGLKGYLCLDDVVVEKAFARQSRWMGWTYAFALKRKVHGFHVVVLSWCAGPWRLPLAFRLWRPQRSCAPHQYRTKLQLAQTMIYEVLTRDLPIEYVVFDTHYTAGWLTKALTHCGLVWNGTLEPKTIVYFHGQRWIVREFAAHLKLRWRPSLGVRAQAVTVYAPKYGTLRLVVTRNRHGNYEYIVSNDLTADLTTLVRRKHSRWSIETVFRDTKQFAGLAACQCRVDQALVRHIAFVLLAFVVLQILRRDPTETLGAVKERWQLCLMQADYPAPLPLKARGVLMSSTA
jgi:hypothetical protein